MDLCINGWNPHSFFRLPLWPTHKSCSPLLINKSVWVRLWIQIRWLRGSLVGTGYIFVARRKTFCWFVVDAVGRISGPGVDIFTSGWSPGAGRLRQLRCQQNIAVRLIHKYVRSRYQLVRVLFFVWSCRHGLRLG